MCGGIRDHRASCREHEGDAPIATPPPRNGPGIMERNMGEGWLPADDPAAGSKPWAEVAKAATPYG